MIGLKLQLCWYWDYYNTEEFQARVQVSQYFMQIMDTNIWALFMLCIKASLDTIHIGIRYLDGSSCIALKKIFKVDSCYPEVYILNFKALYCWNVWHFQHPRKILYTTFRQVYYWTPCLISQFCCQRSLLTSNWFCLAVMMLFYKWRHKLLYLVNVSYFHFY